MKSESDQQPKYRSRYARQSRLPEIGDEGQRRLRQSTVAVVGLGALGSVAAEILCRAGVGNLILIDRDCVELSNLHRQTLYSEADATAGVPKAVAAERRLSELNGELQLSALTEELTRRNATGIFDSADLVVDGTDNRCSRYAINDAALELGIPWVHGAAAGTYGVVLPFMPGGAPCFRCYAPEGEGGEAGGCALTGVLAATTHIVGARQASECMRILVTGEATPGMLYLDPWYGVEERLEVPPRRDCPGCGEAAFEIRNATDLPGGKPPSCEELCGDGTVRIRPERERALSLTTLAAALPESAIVSSAEGVLRFRTEESEVTLFADGRALIRGAGGAGRARRIYSEYVGG